MEQNKMDTTTALLQLTSANVPGIEMDKNLSDFI